MTDTVYVITATNPDGTPFHDSICRDTARYAHRLYPCSGCGISAYGDEDRDERLAAFRAHGYTPHYRIAPPLT